MRTIPPESPKQFAFVLIPSFSLVAFACAVGAIRAANADSGQELYAWKCVSAEGDLVTASSEIDVKTERLEAANGASVVVVCGGDRSHSYSNKTLNTWLKTMATRKCSIGAISDGAFVVAASGLFDGCRSTIHWKCLSAYQERHPNLDIQPSIMEISENRFSCAGGTASLDLMLHFILEDHGPHIVGQIADNYFHDTIRDDSQVQHLTNAFRLASRSTTLTDALLLMEQNLEEKLSVSEIAARVGVSHRQLDRLFKKHLETSPNRHFRQMRLSRASGLLLQTGMSVTEIALASGFQSASHLAHYFRKTFGKTPGEFRRSSN